jgi:hypothetical protein
MAFPYDGWHALRYSGTLKGAVSWPAQHGRVARSEVLRRAWCPGLLSTPFGVPQSVPPFTLAPSGRRRSFGALLRCSFAAR